MCRGSVTDFSCLKRNRVGEATVLGFLEAPDSRYSLNVRRWQSRRQWDGLSEVFGGTTCGKNLGG